MQLKLHNCFVLDHIGMKVNFYKKWTNHLNSARTKLHKNETISQLYTKIPSLSIIMHYSDKRRLEIELYISGHDMAS
jgi:hypothetical protein